MLLVWLAYIPQASFSPRGMLLQDLAQVCLHPADRFLIPGDAQARSRPALPTSRRQVSSSGGCSWFSLPTSSRQDSRLGGCSCKISPRFACIPQASFSPRGMLLQDLAQVCLHPADRFPAPGDVFGLACLHPPSKLLAPRDAQARSRPGLPTARRRVFGPTGRSWFGLPTAPKQAWARGACGIRLCLYAHTDPYSPHWDPSCTGAPPRS